MRTESITYLKVPGTVPGTQKMFNEHELPSYTVESLQKAVLSENTCHTAWNSARETQTLWVNNLFSRLKNVIQT